MGNRSAPEWAIDQYQVSTYKRSGISSDPNRADDEEYIVRLIGRVVLQSGAEVVRSTIRGPAIIGEGTRVEDSFVGPFTSIYYGCEIIRSEIEHSIVLENSRIENIKRIEESLVGQNATVTQSQSKPVAYRIMIGDSSRVEVP